MGYTKDQLLARLQELNIEFTCYDHPVVLTVEAQASYVGHLGGALSKNLLLKDKKHRLYIVSALAGTKVDLKILSQRLGLGKGGLRMAPEEALQEVLQVPLGCVTPFALINESASTVSLLLDRGFKAQECCYFHPLTNDVTIALPASNLDKFLVSIGREPAYVDLEASPVVGKDHPPDLASLVPSELPSLPESVVENDTPVQLSAQNNVPKEKKPKHPPEASNQPNVQSSTTKKGECTTDPLAEATDIEKFVKEILEKISPAFVTEMTKNLSIETEELSESSISDGVRRRVTSDLQSMAMILKNAAYTEGFHAGFEAVIHSGLKGRSPQK
uniref:YbaK/aminoacyl-tRNA synthetase-associated domain-containing protein n=1 Tax=Ananas comosus var. bracteatus TaxID=296719 RepID=A0A6V7P8W3_ANACO|nr:unnamed protein product [Ananas comosus var. bracteatus]